MHVKPILFKCALGLLIAMCTILLLELVAFIMLTRLTSQRLSVFEGICSTRENIFEPRKMYKGTWSSDEFKVRVRTNNRGYRENFNFNDKDVDVAFMGDSFTFGHGVEVEDRYSNIAAEAHTDKTIVSCSYNNGFQPEHYEYYLDQHPDLRPDMVFIGLYLGNDLDSDVSETVIERGNDGKIAALKLPYRTIYRHTLANDIDYKYDWLNGLIRVSNIGKLLGVRINASPELRKKWVLDTSTLPNNKNSLSTEQANLNSLNHRALTALHNIKDIVQSRGGELHVLIIPQNFILGPVEHPHLALENKDMAESLRKEKALIRAVSDFCAAESIHYHDLSGLLSVDDYYILDGHWNTNGHRKAGGYVSSLLSKAWN